MPRAGISGYGVCSALGGNAAESAANLAAPPPPVLPAPPRRFETKLDLPVFEIDLPAAPGEEKLGLPLRFLLHAFREALARARLSPEELPALRVGVAVGTTVQRVLETSVSTDGHVKPFDGWTNRFIFPPYEFHVADAMIANFYPPVSTQLMLTAAYGGYELVMKAYKEALRFNEKDPRRRYRFGTYGDAMLIINK